MGKIKIKSSKDILHRGGIKVAVHSAAGMGKTMLAASCPKPIIILTERTGDDCLTEQNIREVWTKNGKLKKGVSLEIPIIEAYNTADIEAAINYCRESDEYETVVFDSVSEMSKIRLKEELPNHKNAMQAYGVMAMDVDQMLREMRDDEKNWVFLFHSGVEEVFDDTGEPSSTMFVPDFEGKKMQREFPYMVGDVYCLVNEIDDETGEEKRMLRTRQGDTPYYAKNRRGRLDVLEEPHMGHLFWKLSKKK